MRRWPWAVWILVTGCCTAGCKTAPKTEQTVPAAAAAPDAATEAWDSKSEWRRLRSQLPETARQTVVDSYFGVQVADPYRWLERGDDPQVQAWMKRQDRVALDFLSRIPGVKALEQRFREILAAKTIRWSQPVQAAGWLFAMKVEPPKQRPFLVVMTSPDAAERARVVVDPNLLDPAGHTTIDWYRPSPDGKLVALSLSKAGTEAGDLHLFDVATGQRKYEVIPRVQRGTAGGDAAWTRDGQGLFYTRYPREGERKDADADFYQQLWFHQLGTPVARDRYEIGKDFPRIAEIKLVPDHPTGRLLALVQEGDSGRFQHYLRAPDGRWTQLTAWGDRVTGAEFGPDGALYLLSLKDAPKGRFLRLPLDARSLAQAKLVVPEQEGAVQWSFYFDDTFLPAGDRLYATYQVGGPTVLRAFALASGKPAPGPSAPEVSTVSGLRLLQGQGVLFSQMGYTEPRAWYLYDPATNRTHQTALRTEVPVRFEETAVERHFATSKDGTRIPFALLRKRDAPKDGNSPVLATAYGGFGLAQCPRFDPTRLVWIEHGGIFVEAGVRGGGEYGEEWHQQGSGLRKQNTFDDFAAVLKWLVDHGYTRPERIGIAGGSNGGILMGAMITQHPKLQKAVVSVAGVYDMLRDELTPNAQFTVAEYGSIKNREQFRARHAYSPFHRVEPGTSYPAVLLTAGANDPRVDPMNSRKFAAALQHATTSGEPILLQVDYGAGHVGTKLEDEVQNVTRGYAFLMSELGMLPRGKAEPGRPSRGP